MLLNYDVLLRILQFIYEDECHNVLSVCARVNLELCNAASSFLYKRVTLSPNSSEFAVLDLGTRNQKLNGLFEGARLPRNAAYVNELVIGGKALRHVHRSPHSIQVYNAKTYSSIGWLIESGAPRNNFCSVLEKAIQLWPNLRSVSLTPARAPKDLMNVALTALQHCSLLRNLTISSECCGNDVPPLLLRLIRLESLAIANPGRAILDVLPEWLQLLSPTLTAFHLTNNCGSVTPGVLRSFIPHLRQIHSFTLGISYSLSNDDVFAFLQKLQQIRSLDLNYHLQIREPAVRLFLPHLQSLTVNHIDTPDHHNLNYLVKWIRQISSRSPLVQIRLVNSSRFLMPSPISYDGLLDHLGLRHGSTLRVVTLEGDSVGKKALRQLCARCPNLDELVVSIRPDAIVSSLIHSISLTTRLTVAKWDIPELSNIGTVLLTTPHIERPRKLVFDDRQVSRDIFRPPSRLRRLGIHLFRWKAAWEMTSDGDFRFAVERTMEPNERAWQDVTRLYDI